jgi:hypothetical protein
VDLFLKTVEVVNDSLRGPMLDFLVLNFFVAVEAERFMRNPIYLLAMG